MNIMWVTISAPYFVVYDIETVAKHVCKPDQDIQNLILTHRGWLVTARSYQAPQVCQILNSPACKYVWLLSHA